MKKNTLSKLLFLLLILVVASCKKDATSTDNDAYVKLKINGSWLTYNGLGELGLTSGMLLKLI